MLFLHILHVFIALTGLTRAQQEPKFTVTMDLAPQESGSVLTNYNNMIAEIRTNLAALNPGVEVRGTQFLPKQGNPENPPVFDVRLVYDDQMATFRFRADNLYLVGYRGRRNNANQWFELHTDGVTVNRIQGSQFLNCRDSYKDLEKVSGLGGREHVGLGIEQLLAHTESLLTPDARDDLVAGALLVVIEMIAEAARFRPIQEWVAENIDSSLPLPEYLIDCENIWGKASKAALQYTGPRVDGSGDPPLRLAILPNNPLFPLGEYAELFRLIALALCPNSWTGPMPGPSGSKGGKLRRRSHGGSIRPRQTTPVDLIGRDLVEIFDVNVWKNDGTNPGLIYGIVDTNDGLWHYPIFNNDKDNAENLDTYTTLTTAGPIRALSAEDEWVMSVDLKDPNENHLAIGGIHWYPRPGDGDQNYGKVMSQEIFNEDKSAYATVTWAVVQNAAEALINLVVNDKDGQTGSVDILGTIFASTDTFPHSKAMIFDSTVNGQSKSVDWGSASMSRAVVVAMDATLTVDATHVWSLLDTDNNIADGNVHFDKPRAYISQSQKIQGGAGNIEVRVTWM